MQDAPTIVADDEEAVEHTERNRWHGEEVHRRNRFPMVSKEGEPTFGRVRRSGCLVGTNFPLVLIYMCAARTGPCPPKSPCSVEAMLIVFKPSLPRIAPFFVADEVLARDRRHDGACLS
jgi:hypothetical protein